MLEFLVTSKARRRLLQVLWGNQEASGSTAYLAALAGLGFASAYRELRSMEALGLVTAERKGRAVLYRRNPSHPFADALRTFVMAPAVLPDDPEAGKLRSQLASLGAPVQHEAVGSSSASVEETVVRGAHLARRDPDVARALPVCLYQQRDVLDPERLRDQAVQHSEKRSLGFFLDLTTALSGDRRFAAWARPLKDRRWTQTPHPFFHTTFRSRRGRKLAEQRTPRVARLWGWQMNMEMDAFRSTFEKFVPHAA